jgi:hypothetical protein
MAVVRQRRQSVSQHHARLVVVLHRHQRSLQLPALVGSFADGPHLLLGQLRACAAGSPSDVLLVLVLVLLLLLRACMAPSHSLITQRAHIPAQCCSSSML